MKGSRRREGAKPNEEAAKSHATRVRSSRWSREGSALTVEEPEEQISFLKRYI